MDDIQPLVLKVAGKLVPVAIGGMAADVKFLVNQLRDCEECGGWQYIPLSTTRRTESTFFVRQKCIHNVLLFRGVFERAGRHGSSRFVHFHRFACEKRILPLPLPWFSCFVCRVCYACYVF